VMSSDVLRIRAMFARRDLEDPTLKSACKIEGCPPCRCNPDDALIERWKAGELVVTKIIPLTPDEWDRFTD
jgi:hypothetical protein